MSFTITLDLPDEVRPALDAAARDEGVSASEIVGEALKKYFFVRRFRELRQETLEHMRNSGQGDLTDEDVFRAIS